MIQCKDCEYFPQDESGQVHFACDPFRTIKEPECLQKWELMKISQMVAGYQATLDYYRRLAPMQEKMFKVMEREIDDMNEAEQWKIDHEEAHEEDEDDWRESLGF